MNRIFISIALITLLVSTVALAAPSAKFAATYSDTPSLSSTAFATCSTDDGGSTVTGDCTADRDVNTGHQLARMKVPQDKELLVGLSAEIGLMTFGSVKGKNGGSATAVADADAVVSIKACPVGPGDCRNAAPGSIILSKRVQSLSAKLGGVIKECTDRDEDGTIDVSVDCLVNDEEIALMLETTAAHHFNFVLPNMPQGEYDIVATFTTSADADVHLCDYTYTGTDPDYTTQDCDADGSVAGTAAASSIINSYMLTVQTVRAAKGGIIDADIVDGNF